MINENTDNKISDTDPCPPPVGSWAETARMMAEMFPDDGMDWDAWKDLMKETEHE